MKRSVSALAGIVLLVGGVAGQSWQSGPQSPFAYGRFDGEYFPGTGKVYFLGGRIGNSTTLGRIWSYDPQAGTYADQGLDMPKTVSNYDICLLRDDHDLPGGDTFGLYIVGGRYDQAPNYTDSVQVYYPQSNTARILDTDLFPGRSGGQITVAQSAIVHSNLMYVMGGFSQTGNVTSAETWLFDPLAAAGSRWSRLPDLALARAYPIVAVVDSFIFAFGGDTWRSPDSLMARSQCQRFNVNDTAAGWSLVTDLPAANAQARAFGFDSDHLSEFAGKVIVAGRGVWPSESAHCYIYDVAGDDWQSFPSLAQRRRNHAGAYLPAEAGGTGTPGIWVWGGRQNSDTNALRVSEYYAIDVVGVEEERGPALRPTRVAPNPGKRVLRLSGAEPAALLDIAGREVITLRPGANDIRALAPGVYFLRPRGPGQPEKVIIQR
ncbi:MAG TPA: hypothetical protein ENN51_09610 [candidate division WOR-3 bacterium]|uniref:T9SS type A sorting domain-containing protein n=1 Tax=candidate division WOR-3 bacterium TaxID=2052148 RepID=A0A7V0XGC9_UNCW3|nr:hypothetical protein [candidate division WOR-3 bacterium]